MRLHLLWQVRKRIEIPLPVDLLTHEDRMLMPAAVSRKVRNGIYPCSHFNGVAPGEAAQTSL